MTTEDHLQHGQLPDRRTGERQISVLINAGLSHQDRDALCRIRNLSSGGVMIECGLPLGVDDPVSLHLRSGDIVTGRVRWTRDGKAGIAFDDPASSALVTGTAARAASPIGHPLFRRSAWAGLSAGQKRERVAVKMISPTGIVVESGPDWGRESVFRVSIDELGEHMARLAGAGYRDDEDRLALIFMQPLHYRAFSEWLISTPAAGTMPEAVAPAERPHWA